MPEGLSAPEVGKGIGEHARHGGHAAEQGRDRWLSIAEAVLLSIVALTAAWSGFGAAKWSTESSVSLAESSAARTKANRAEFEAAELRNLDSSAFEAWFAAFIAGNEEAMRIAERRFRDEFRVAFDAWRATNPESNTDTPRGPTYMPEYQQPKLAEAQALDTEADQHFAEGSSAGKTSDDYIRATIFLASVLFIVGISTQFKGSGVRYGLVGLGLVLLVVSVVQLAQLPRPPS
jgi:hypothetical protein